MEKLFRVAGIGELLWDLLPQGKVLGGAPANFAYHAGMLGAESYIVSAVGKDELGREITDRLSSYPIHLQIETIDFPTGVVNVTLNDEGIPRYDIKKEVAWDYITFSDETIVAARKLNAVCFGSLAQRSEISGASIEKYIRCIPEPALKIFDINLRQQFYSKALLDKSFHMSNILKINDEELHVVAPMFGFTGNDQSVCRQLLEKYRLKLVACTYGANGSYLYTPEEISFMPTPEVEVKDTVGAGDAFTAALAMGLLRNLPLKRCHEMAVELSAYICTCQGAMPTYTEEIKCSLQ